MSKRRFIYRPNPETGEIESIEVGTDYVGGYRSTGDLGKFQYDLKMPDGTYVGDRHDYKRYLKNTGYVPQHEFKGDIEKATSKREAYLKGENRSTPQRREALAKALYQKGLLK